MGGREGETLRVLTQRELARLYREELRSTFPPSELKPLLSMEQMRKKGRYDPLGLFGAGGALEGYALFWLDEVGEYPLLDYLGVPAEKRGKGIGARLLALAGERFASARGILAEAETEESGDPAERELRRRRLAFYGRCGFVTLPYECALFGVRYKVLLLPHGPVDPARALERHRGLYLGQFHPKQFERYIQIPLREGEKVKKFASWRE